MVFVKILAKAFKILAQASAVVRLFFDFSPTTPTFLRLMTPGTGILEIKTLQFDLVFSSSKYALFHLHAAFQLPVHVANSQELRSAFSHGI